MPAYCNITTDLQDVFSRIEEYQAKEIIDDWTSAGSNIYTKMGTGYVSAVWQDNTTVYTAASTAAVTAGQYYYNADTDKLYIQTSDSSDPVGHTITVGVDWDSFKTNMRNKAMMIVDAYLNSVYSTPLVPRDNKTHDSNYYYEWPIVEATACLTCSLIIKRVSSNDPNGVLLFKRAINPVPEPGELKGILDMYRNGELVRQDQISPREVGNWTIFPYASNTVSDYPILYGTYTGSQYKRWRIQIDTGGIPGTGTFKVSYDGGTNWDLTNQDMKDASNDEYRMYIADGVYVYWPNITWVLNEYWDVEMFPITDTAGIAKLGTLRITR